MVPVLTSVSVTAIFGESESQEGRSAGKMTRCMFNTTSRGSSSGVVDLLWERAKDGEKRVQLWMSTFNKKTVEEGETFGLVFVVVLFASTIHALLTFWRYG